MDKKTIDMAFKIDKLRFELFELKNVLLDSNELSLDDKCRLIDSVTKLQELDFIKSAVAYAYDDWLSYLNDCITSSRWS